MSQILLVEDNVTQSLELKLALEHHDYRVITAYDGDAALRLLQSNADVDLIISDLMMPGLTGHEVCRAVKSSEKSAQIPVILITASMDLNELFRCIQSGADAFLSKPYQPQILISRIETLLNNRSSLNGQPSHFDGDIKVFGEELKISSSSTQLFNLLATTIEDLIRTSRDFESQQLELKRAKGRLEFDSSRIRSELGSTQEQLNLRNRAIESLDQALIIVEWDGADYRIADSNSAIEKITGFKANDLIGKPIPILTRNLESYVEFLDGFERARTLGLFTIEMQINHTNGSIRWCRLNINPIGIHQDSAFSFACILTDITIDKHIELALSHTARIASSGDDFFHEALAELGKILGTAVGFIGRIDNAGHSTMQMALIKGELFPAWSFRIAGTPIEKLEATGKGLISNNIQADFPDAHFFEDHGVNGFALQPIRGAHGTQHGYIGVMSGTEFVNAESVMEVLHVYSIAVGAELVRMRTTQQYQQIFELAPSAVILSDTEGTIRLANAQAQKLFGYQKSELEGKSVDMLVPDDLPIAHNQMRATFYQNPSPRTLYAAGTQLRARRKDGSEFPADISLSPIESESGLHVLTNVRDITLELQQEEDRAARTAAEQANIAKSVFLANMSHEIRTPINGIIGSIELLARLSLTSAQMELARTIIESSTTLLHVIDDILDFSKIEAGKLAIEMEAISIQAIAESTCNGLASMARKKGVTIKLHTDPSLPPSMLSDPIRVRQILNNLLANAIKFSVKPDRSGLVWVKVMRTASDRIELQVRDNGIGMSKKFQKTLFEPFSQAEASTTRRYGGTGLGLTICKHLTDLLQGDIKVTSKLDVGTTFSVSLPVTESLQIVPAPDTSDVSGLQCAVFSADPETIASWCSYLEAAGARTIGGTQLDDLKKAVGNHTREFVLVTDASEQSLDPWLQDLPATERPSLVLINHSPTWTNPFQRSNGTLIGNFNLPTQSNILAGVAIAAGRRGLVDEESPANGQQYHPPPPDRESAIAQHRLVLIAEDNEVNQEVIQRQLEALGFLADIANNGQEALEAWRGGDYSLLLTDVHMPIMDGYELAAAVRKLPGEMSVRPVIALTANALASEKEKCIDAGMNDYLSKPVSLEQLYNKIMEWLPGKAHLYAVGRDKNPSVELSGETVFDADELARIMGTSSTNVQKHIQKFRDMLAIDQREIDAAFAAKNVDTIAMLAHRIKSSARMVGARYLADCCEELELLSKAGFERLDKNHLESFQNRAAQVIAHIDNYMQGLNDK